MCACPINIINILMVQRQVRALPPAFSYSPLVIPLSGDVSLGPTGSLDKDHAKAKRNENGKKGNVTLLRRDLFDARYQLISEDTSDDPTSSDSISQVTSEPTALPSALESVTGRGDTDALAFIDNPSDLVPGVYEGGLKTWECSLDLVDCLASLSSIDDNEEAGMKWVSGKRVIEVRVPFFPFSISIHSTNVLSK